MFEGLPYIETQLNQVRLKSAKWTKEIEHTKSFQDLEIIKVLQTYKPFYKVKEKWKKLILKV